LLKDFADLIQKTIGAAPIRTVNTDLLQVIGRVGDLAQRFGWKQPPLTTFRYHNMITSEVQDLEPLQRIVGPLPYSQEQAATITVNWMRYKGFIQ
jgi:hypothetical protein